jgi:hypothetical protein
MKRDWKSFTLKSIKTVLIVLPIAIGFLFNSCDNKDDYYSLGDIWISMGIIEKQDNGNNFSVLIDNGDTLVPISYNVPYFPIKDSQRVMVNYTILDEVGQSTKKYWVKINNIYDILLKEVIELNESNSDSIGNDPVNIDDIWISKNYLNVEFTYRGGSKTHFINLTCQKRNNIDLSQPIVLDLKHNANNDTDRYSLTGFVTFDLKKIKLPNQDSVRFVVNSTDYKGNEHTFSGTYYY